MSRSDYPSRKSWKLAASHQRSWLWGRNAVVETLTAGRWPVVELLVSQDLEPTQFDVIASLAAPQELQIQQVAAERIAELCQAQDHQGHLLRLGPFPCGSLDDLRALVTAPATARRFPPLFVICDRIQDAHNFGAILRSCEAMAVDGVIIGTHAQCSITPHVARASSGAVNNINVYLAECLLQAASTLASHGITIIGAADSADGIFWDLPVSGGLALVIGSEATGIASDLISRCNHTVRIPMFGRGTSLNAAVAAGILLTEFRRRQQEHSTNA